MISLIVCGILYTLGIHALAPISQYESAKQECVTAEKQIMRAANNAEGSDEYRLAKINASLSRCREIDETLAGILNRKPYGLALTQEEKDILDGIKTRKRRHIAQRIESGMDVYKVYNNDSYPQGTNAEIVKALEEDKEAVGCLRENAIEKNSNGELLDPFGQPYPMDVEKLEAIAFPKK